MNKKEFAIIVAAIEHTYKTQPVTKETMKIWYECLKDIDYEIADKAIQKIIMTNKFYPSIAEIREACYELIHGEQISGEQAWNIFKKHINLHSTHEDYEKLKADYPEVYKIVSHLGARDLLMGNPSFVRPEFERIFNQSQDSSKKNKLISEGFDKDIQALKDKIYSNMRLGDGSEI